MWFIHGVHFLSVFGSRLTLYLEYKQNPKIDISHSVGKKPKKKVEKKLELDKLFLTSKDSHQRDIRAKEYELKKCIGNHPKSSENDSLFNQTLKNQQKLIFHLLKSP